MDPKSKAKVHMPQQKGRGTAKRGPIQNQRDSRGPRQPPPQDPFRLHHDLLSNLLGCADDRDGRHNIVRQGPLLGPSPEPYQPPNSRTSHSTPGRYLAHGDGRHTNNYSEPYHAGVTYAYSYATNSECPGQDGYRRGSIQHHRGDYRGQYKGGSDVTSRAGRAPWGGNFARRWYKKRGQGAQSHQSEGQSLIEFKRLVTPGELDAASEMSDSTSVCTADWPAEEVEEYTRPHKVLPQELEELEDAVDEASSRPAPRARVGYISVFWDIENCSVPKDVSAYEIVKKIRDSFYKGQREADFIVACDIVKMKANVTEELNNAHVTVIHVSSERKNSADEKLRVRLRRFADLHQLSGSTIVLISGDVDFAAELHEMRYHNMIHVVLIHNEQAKKELVDVANESYKYADFVGGLKPKGVSTAAVKEKRPTAKASQPRPTAGAPEMSDGASPAPDANEKATVVLQVKNNVGNAVFWKNYLADVVPPEFVLKVHQPEVLHLFYRNMTVARKARKALEKKAKEDPGAPICIALDGNEEQSPSTTTSMDKLACSKKLQKAMTLHKFLVDACLQQINNIKGNKAKKELKVKLDKQLSYYEAQLHEFLSVTNTVMHDSKVQDASERIGAEVRHLELALPIYAVKSSLLKSIKEEDVTVLSLFPGSGSGIQLAMYLVDLGNPKTLIIKPNKLSAQGNATYAKSVMGLKEVEVRTEPTGSNSSTSSVVVTTADCFFYEYLQCSGGLSEFQFIIVDDVQESCPYQNIILLLLKHKFQGHAKIVLCISALSQCGILEKIFGKGAYAHLSCGVDFPVNVIWKPTGKDVVVQCVQEVLSVIRSNKNPTDIVVFLASAAEASLADALLTSEIEKLPKLKDQVEHCYLWEGCSIWKGPQASNTWRVVFALHVSDVNILRPNYVIDCGMYEQFICKNGAKMKQKLVVSPALASQRMTVAGMLPDGVCIRLYAPKALEAQHPQAMEPCFTEDILLRLMHRKMDVSEYFPTVFSKESYDHSLQSLKMLGAIQNGTLTTEGCTLCRIALEPRLAKLALEAAKCMPLEDALAIALLAFEDITCAFYPLGPEGERQEKAFENVCSFSDILTTYHDWLDVPKKGKPLWCKLNGINESFLKCLHRSITKHSEHFKMLDCNRGSKSSSIGAKLLTSFPEGLCAISAQGYVSHSIGTKLKVSPNSVVSRNVASQHVVCCLFSIPANAKKPQLLNFAAVDIEAVPSASHKSSLPTQGQHFASGASLVQPLTFGPIGNLIWNYQFADKGCLSAVEDGLRDSTGCTNVQISLNAERHCLVVHIPERFHGLAASFLQRLVSREIQNLSKKDMEAYIDPSGIFYGSGALSVVLDGKGNAVDVISPGNFRTLKVMDVKIPISGFRNWINEFGRIVQYKILKNERAFFITYKTTAEAERAYAAMCDKPNEMTAHCIPEEALQHRRVAEQCRPAYRLSVRAVRRHCTGTGFAILENEASLDSIAYCLPYECKYRDATIVCQRNKKEKTQLYISGIPVAADRDEIKELLNAAFPVKIVSVRLVHELLFETCASEYNAVCRNVHKVLGGKALLELRQPKPKDSDFCGIAFIDDVLQGHTIFELACGLLLKTPRAVPSVPLELRPVLLGIFTLPQRFFLLIKDEFQASLRDIQKGYYPQDNISVEVHAAAGGQPLVRVELQANNVNDFRKAAHVVNKALRFVEVLKDVRPQEVLRYTYILDLQETVFVDWKACGVRLLGNPVKVAEAQVKIEEFAAKAAKGISKSLPLLTKEATVVKSFMTAYGFTLRNFLDKCDLDKATVDFNHGRLTAFGSAASLKKAIENLAHLEVRRMADDKEEFCPVCREVPEENCHRLESCGHIYCVRCLAWVVCNAPLPLCCISEECGQEWVAMDIRRACHMDEVVPTILGRRALEECVLANPSEWYCCPVPQCHYVCHYTQISPAGKEAPCPTCGNAVCFQCNSLFHYGMSCDMFRALSSSDTFSDEQWVQQDPTSRRLCHGCEVALERSGTERVISCWRCRELSCWGCRRIFQEAAKARAHTSC
ncbi:uncharacterized protein LOC135391375 [Ornithodoros turicata]|uniref:uncharacterized protein LOC135391375 n=1 Tax=Ornithodoros turicata TaxID=34597 RepID=UPI0031399573